MRFQILAGLFDFLGTVFSFFAILACIVLLTTLFTWLRGDIVDVFDSLQTPIVNAFDIAQ